MTDEQLLDAFETYAIDRDAWTHDLHVRVAYILLRRHGLAEAIDRMRSGLRALLAAHDVEDGPTAGYNETITVAWMHIIHTTICEHGASENSQQFLEEQPQLNSRFLLRSYYSTSIWTKQDCKRSFVAPDLAPLPTPRRGRTSPRTGDEASS